MAVTNAFTAFLKFEEDYKPSWFSLESKVYGDYWAGTEDFFGDLSEKPDIGTVADWKTSSGLYGLDARIQTAAYRSTHGDACGRNCAVRLDKETAEYEFKDYSKTYKQDLKIFNLMVQLFYESRPRIAKKAGYKWT